MSGIIRAPRPDRGWTEIPNTTIRDQRLSYRARGVLVRLLSNADGFRMTAIDLAHESPDGRHSILSALHELKEAGYIVREKRQNDKGHWGTETFVFDNPQTEVRFPDLGSPDLGSPDAGSPDPNKKYQEKNQKKKQLLPLQQPAHVQSAGSSDLQKLEIPANLDAAIMVAMLAQVDGLDAETAQAVIDEAIGIKDAGALRGSLPSLTAGLVKKVKKGEFQPAAGVAVKQARRRAQERQPPDPDLPKASPEAAARGLAAAKRALARAPAAQ